MDQPQISRVDSPIASAAVSTALLLDLDQGASQVVALNAQLEQSRQAVASAADDVIALSVTVEAPQVEAQQPQAQRVDAQQQQAEPVSASTKTDTSRANNDPRSRRREAKAAQVAKLTPAQVPTLPQYTVGSLIRHVYGEDCKVLIDQFGLIATFNRALLKFTEQYNRSLATAQAASKAPVTRDAVVPVSKPVSQDEPVVLLDLTPPKTVERRVNNDPRQRRREAKQAAEQALAAVVAGQATALASTAHRPTLSDVSVQPVASTANSDAVVETQAHLDLDAQADAAESESAVLSQQVLAVTDVSINEASNAVQDNTALTTANVDAEVLQDAIDESAQDDAEADDTMPKTDKDKASRRGRPRGRPPKKTNITPE